MALTRGDKIIILGAVVLAASVVMGLALLKKSGLVPGGSTTTSVVAPDRPVSPVPPAVGPAPPSVPPVPTRGVDAADPSSRTAPATANGATASADTSPPAASAVSASASRSALGSDEALDRMFSEMTDTPVAPNRIARPLPPQAKADTPSVPPVPGGEVPAQAPGTPVVVAPSPTEPSPGESGPKAPSDATASAPNVTMTKPADPAQSKPKRLPRATPAAKAKPAEAGTVVRLVAEEKNGAFLLTIYTSRPPGQFYKMFMADPPRMVLDLGGAWTYTGPMDKTTGDSFIRRIRVGRHADKLRVVLDMGPDALTRLRGTPTLERVPEGVVLKIPN